MNICELLNAVENAWPGADLTLTTTVDRDGEKTCGSCDQPKGSRDKITLQLRLWDGKNFHDFKGTPDQIISAVKEKKTPQEVPASIVESEIGPRRASARAGVGRRGRRGVSNQYTEGMIDGIMMLAKAAKLDFTHYGQSEVRVTRSDGSLVLNVPLKKGDAGGMMSQIERGRPLAPDVPDPLPLPPAVERVIAAARNLMNAQGTNAYTNLRVALAALDAARKEKP